MICYHWHWWHNRERERDNFLICNTTIIKKRRLINLLNKLLKNLQTLVHWKFMVISFYSNTMTTFENKRSLTLLNKQTILETSILEELNNYNLECNQSNIDYTKFQSIYLVLVRRIFRIIDMLLQQHHHVASTSNTN